MHVRELWVAASQATFRVGPGVGHWVEVRQEVRVGVDSFITTVVISTLRQQLSQPKAPVLFSKQI